MSAAATRLQLRYVPASHLDLFWLGTHYSCLERGAEVIKAYLDSCLADPQQTYLIETPVFAEYLLARYPDYREPLLRLVREGRVEVGAAYVDRFETIDPEESLVRHNLFGKRWCREQIGVDSRLVCHFDLPGYIPQIAQICAKSGVAYYLTSRKAFPYGKAFRYVSPDGSKVLCIHFPVGYGYAKTEQIVEHLGEVSEGFPRGVVLMAGGAGDLAGLETFIQRNGKPLAELIAEDREKHPDLSFEFGTPTPVFDLYAQDDLPEHSGEVPSVWGSITSTAPLTFTLNHEVEATLVAAEQLAALAAIFGHPGLPERSDVWKGALHDDRFFGRKDPIPPGRELEGLWRMQLVVQDHNGGGQEGALTEFYKLDLKRRAISYGRQIIDHGLAQLAGAPAENSSKLALYNQLSWRRAEVVDLPLPAGIAAADAQATDSAGRLLASQPAPDGKSLRVLVPDLPAVGYSTVQVSRRSTRPTPTSRIVAETSADGLVVRTAALELAVGRDGNIRSLRLAGDGAELVEPSAGFGSLVAYREIDNDVRMRFAEDVAPVSAETIGVELAEVGPVAARIVVERRLFDATCRQTISVYADLPRVDLETRLYWWGATQLQIQQLMPFAEGFDQVYYGTPFHATSFRDVMPEAHPWKRDEIPHSTWERYREVLRWIDVGDGRRGVTVTSTHAAYCADGSRLAAVLLRTPVSCGDRRFYWDNPGELVWRYNLWPHAGDWRSTQAYRRGWEMDNPVRLLGLDYADNPPVAPPDSPLVRLSPDNLVLTSLKPAENGEGVILRFYEAEGKAVGARVGLARPIQASRLTNLIEDDGEELRVDRGEVGLAVGPWEVATLRLQV